MKRRQLAPREVDQEENEVDRQIAEGKARKPKPVKRLIKRQTHTKV